MPRFYFDTADRKSLRDEEGMEFDDAEDARREAVITVGEMTDVVVVVSNESRCSRP